MKSATGEKPEIMLEWVGNIETSKSYALSLELNGIKELTECAELNSEFQIIIVRHFVKRSSTAKAEGKGAVRKFKSQWQS